MSATPPQDPSPGMPYMRNQPRIVDRCPACGSRSLFIGAGGFLTCSVITCANPATGDVIESLRAELSTARATNVRWGHRLDAALAQVTALREALARVFTIPGWCHSDPDAYLVVQAALAPAVTATPSPTEEAAHPSNTASPYPGPWSSPDGSVSTSPTKHLLHRGIPSLPEPADHYYRAWMQKHEECAAALLRAERAERVLADLVRQVYEHKNRGEHDDMADAGCPDCTHGTVPDRSNTGRCAYHSAAELLRETEGK